MVIFIIRNESKEIQDSQPWRLWLDRVFLLIGLVLIGSLFIRYGPTLFTPASNADEDRLSALASSFVPPKSTVQIVRTWHNWTGPAADVDADYSTTLTPVEIMRYYDSTFAGRGWQPCGPGLWSLGWFAKSYRKGNDQAVLRPLRQNGAIHHYRIEFSMRVPNPC